MQANVALFAKRGMDTMRISDANSVDDLRAVLHSGGMFAIERVVILEGVLENEEMHTILIPELPALKASADHFFMLEEKPDAATRKLVEKHAEKFERFDSARKADGGTTIFALANALRVGNKKALWVGYQQELLNDAAPEAIHGVLFWAAKDMFLKSRSDSDKVRAKKLIANLTELPHEARRRGEDLEYALERFVLGKM